MGTLHWGKPREKLTLKDSGGQGDMWESMRKMEDVPPSGERPCALPGANQGTLGRSKARGGGHAEKLEWELPNGDVLLRGGEDSRSD